MSDDNVVDLVVLEDFERIVAKVENHTFAWNCLVIDYKKLKQYKKSEQVDYLCAYRIFQEKYNKLSETS
jgi:hypothetical protein